MMLWCLISAALLFVLLAIGTLTVKIPRIDMQHLRPPHIHLGRVMRGCVAGVFLLVAIGLVGVVVLAGI